MKTIIAMFIFLEGVSSTAQNLPGLIEKYSQANNLDPKVVAAVIQVESGGNPRAVSADGSYGLMQLLPATARVIGFQGPRSKLKDPETNIKFGTFYLAYLKGMFDSWCDVLDAYNRGYVNVQQWPYRGDWHRHRYVGRILQSIDEPEDSALKTCVDTPRISDHHLKAKAIRDYDSLSGMG